MISFDQDNFLLIKYKFIKNLIFFVRMIKKHHNEYTTSAKLSHNIHNFYFPLLFNSETDKFYS